MEDETEKSEGSAMTDGLREVLRKQRTILISSEISQTVAAAVTMQLLVMNSESDAPINFFINSQGGHVESGDTIHDVVKFVRPRVRMIGTGWVASAGALIYVSVPLEDRYCLPNTRFLLHQPSGGIGGSWWGVEIGAREMLLMHQRLNKVFADATGKTVEQIERDTRRDFWLDAQAAKEYGLVGKIIKSVNELT